MKILMIAINDPAGMAISFTKAINLFTEHTCRLITLELRYNYMFDKDLHLPWLQKEDWDEVEHLLKNSDIFHFHMTADEDLELGPFKPKDFIQGKIIVHHHHGHPEYRSNPGKYRQKYHERQRRKLLVSTPDLLNLFPQACWLPNLVPIYDPLYLPWEGEKDSDLIKVAHSPTRQDLKNTDYLITTIHELKKQGLPVEVNLIVNTEHKECLRKKRRCHVLFDHLQGYYGVSSLEGLSQGLCVVAGLDEWNQRQLKEFTGQEILPWIISDAIKLPSDIKWIVNDAARRQAISLRSRKFMKDYWNECIIINKLLDFYSY